MYCTVWMVCQVYCFRKWIIILFIHMNWKRNENNMQFTKKSIHADIQSYEINVMCIHIYSRFSMAVLNINFIKMLFAINLYWNITYCMYNVCMFAIYAFMGSNICIVWWMENGDESKWVRWISPCYVFWYRSTRLGVTSKHGILSANRMLPRSIDSDVIYYTCCRVKLEFLDWALVWCLCDSKCSSLKSQ